MEGGKVVYEAHLPVPLADKRGAMVLVNISQFKYPN